MTIDKKKIAGIVLAILAGLAAAGIIIWQPWNRPEPETKAPVQQIDGDETPEAPGEKGPVLQVGGKEIACTIYEGDGWSIYVPEGWTVREGPGGMWMSRDEAVLEVWRQETADYDGSFASVTAGKDGGRERMLYLADGKGGSWELRGFASNPESWAENEKLMMETARTFRLNGEAPFADWGSLAEEPDWQEAEGMTVLFLDKDGYVLDDEVRKAVEAYMGGWSGETRALFTGEYRVEEIAWISSYSGLVEDYVNVFRADVRYELSQEGMERIGDWEFPVQDGCVQPPDGLLLAVYHDGGWVGRTMWWVVGTGESLAGWAVVLAL